MVHFCIGLSMRNRVFYLNFALCMSFRLVRVFKRRRWNFPLAVFFVASRLSMSA